MGRRMLCLTLMLFSVPAAFAAAPRTLDSPIKVIRSPEEGFWPLFEAYPILASEPSVDSFTFIFDVDFPCATDPLKPLVGSNQRWDSFGLLGPENVRAVPGVFALKSIDVEGSRLLDVYAFAVCNDDQVVPGETFVQSYRLLKEIPGSAKCPGAFAHRQYYQFGNEVRTWWALLYTQPGTRFTLEIMVRCIDKVTKGPTFRKVVLCWEVVATLDTIRAALDMMHAQPMGTTEIPCIAAENLYLEIRHFLGQDGSIRAALGTDGKRLFERPRTVKEIVAAQDELFMAEALIIACASFANEFAPERIFSGFFPPSNDPQMGDWGYTGIIDTPENPCACKLIADLEYLGKCYETIPRESTALAAPLRG